MIFKVRVDNFETALFLKPTLVNFYTIRFLNDTL